MSLLKHKTADPCVVVEPEARLVETEFVVVHELELVVVHAIVNNAQRKAERGERRLKRHAQTKLQCLSPLSRP